MKTWHGPPFWRSEMCLIREKQLHPQTHFREKTAANRSCSSSLLEMQCGTNFGLMRHLLCTYESRAISSKGIFNAISTLAKEQRKTCRGTLIMTLKQHDPEKGGERFAKELRKGSSWEPLFSPNPHISHNDHYIHKYTTGNININMTRIYEQRNLSMLYITIDCRSSSLPWA